MKIRNEVAIVTGASRGIGRQIALRLASRGINVFACYENNEDLAQTLEDEIISYSGTCRLFKGDITDHNVLSIIASKANEELGRIDYLINNAGVFERRLLNELTSEDFDITIKANLKSALFLCKEVEPYMRKQKFGKIVNISAVIGSTGYKYSSHYVCSKSGLIGLTKSLAIELAPDITVNCILPGFILTTNLKSDSPVRRAERLSKIPLKRIGQPDDIAGVVDFLLSKDADYITGETIEVSGGYSLCI